LGYQEKDTLNTTEVPKVCVTVQPGFKRLLYFITTGLPGVFISLDDVVIVSKTYQQHQGQHRQLLSRFRKYGLKCLLSKLQLAAEEVNYLGYNISKKWH
jgi:hypothetical protein